RRIKDKRVCTLVKAFLKSGVMTQSGDREETWTGTPQGSLCSAEHNAPYEQCWVMRSVGLIGPGEGGFRGSSTAHNARRILIERFGSGAGPARSEVTVMVALSALVSGLDAELRRLGYKDSTLVWYRGCWRRMAWFFA